MRRSRPSPALSLAALGLCLTAAGCGRGAQTAPPAPGAGAVGYVSVDNAGAAQNPKTPALAGGPAGQTPDYGQPGGTGSVVYSDRSGPPAASSDNPHVGR